MKLSHISPLHAAAPAIWPTLRRCPGHQHPLHAAVPVPLRNIIAGASPTPSTPSEHCRRSSAIMAHRASRLEAHFTAAEGTFVLQPTAITPPQAHFRPGTNQTVLQLLKHTLTPYLSACPHRQHPSSAPQRRLFCLSYAFRHSKQTCFPRKKAYRPKRKNAIQRHQMAIYKLNV